MKKILLILFLVPAAVNAQVSVVKSRDNSLGTFPLSVKGQTTGVYTDAADEEVVKRTAQMFIEDAARVTGNKMLQPVAKNKLKKNMVIIGTIGKNVLIDQLISNNKLQVSSIKNQWERFCIKLIKNPFPNVEQALVIAGSDRRGTAYGVFTVSEAIGVSPWYWWADVPVKRSENIFIKPVNFVSSAPSVKYRGIFINDEDWGLKPWATKTYEKQLGDIGPATYEKICELLLRLKANMFAPAMHSCTGAFYSHPESKLIADAYAIIVTTSHCEPLLFNNAAKSEWDTKKDGDWDYGTNSATIKKKLDDRVKEAALYENIYTIGLRGLHDEGIRGKYTMNEKVNLVANAMNDQRDILKKYLKKNITDIPQIYVPYKEALDVYNNGLEVPQEATLVWTDDNYGYIKRLSNPAEQKRSGRSGVYYHTSYLGAPHDYLWLCTTPPVLMYEELHKAYQTGADRYWLLNVGDIKPAELAMQTFFDLAWNINGYNYEKIHEHQGNLLSDIFGASYKNDIQYILNNYYRLAWSRKPEFMGWEREWDAPAYKDISPGEFSFQHYNEAQQRLTDYKRISDLTQKILHALPEEYQPAFFEILGYPVQGAYQMNRKFLMYQLNHEQVKAGNLDIGNWAAKESQIAFDSINSLTVQYNSMLNGKWNGMMQLAPAFNAKYQNMPPVIISEGAGMKEVDITPAAEKLRLDKCTVIDLRNYTVKWSKPGHTLRLVKGIGYDWESVQLGEATEIQGDAEDLKGSRFEYGFTAENADSVTVYVYSVPFFPLYNGKSTAFGVSVDQQKPVVIKNEPKEFSKEWKDQVLQNSFVSSVKFPVKKVLGKHTLSLICGDPGVIIQKVVIDWGGLQKTYIGPGRK